MAQRKKRASNYLEPGNKRYIQDLEEAGRTSGRTQQQADQEAKIDQIFDVETPKVVNQDVDTVDKIFDFTRKLFN